MYFSNADGTVQRIVDHATGESEPYFYSFPNLTPAERATCGVSILNEFTCGRPLGILFDSNDTIYVADAYRGILRASKSNPTNVEVVASHYPNGNPIIFANSMLIDEDENVLYFTTSSDKYYRNRFVATLIDNEADGKLVKVDLATGALEILVDDLKFGNGIQFWEPKKNSKKGPKGIIINETNSRRLRRYYLRGPRAGQNDVFVADIGGYCDNLTKYGDNYLVALYSESQDWMTAIMEHEELQDFMLQANPAEVMGKFDALGLIKVVSPRGKVLETWISTDPENFAQVAEADIVGDKAYLGSVVRPHYGVMNLSDLTEVDAAYIGCDN
ncbi:MAG: hypothetical protein MHM6MM_000394 [Cercozoa sp. M6MM]